MILAAHSQARSRFEQSRTVATGSEDAVKAIEEAKSVATILRQNLVQGEQEEADRYKLNIHDEIERGDNDTIKLAGKPRTNLTSRKAS